MLEKCYEKLVSNIILGVCALQFSQSTHELRIGNQDTENCIQVRDVFDTRHNII